MSPEPCAYRLTLAFLPAAAAVVIALNTRIRRMDRPDATISRVTRRLFDHDPSVPLMIMSRAAIRAWPAWMPPE